MKQDPEYFDSVAKELYESNHTEYLVDITTEQPVNHTNLTFDFFLGDRATRFVVFSGNIFINTPSSPHRESGFDISHRFGPFGGSTHHFAPVCLNSLLYKAECDMAIMAKLLGRSHVTLVLQ
jgi:neutral trehalase